MQTSCAVCAKGLPENSPICNACHGIKYCSAKCMADNA